MLLTDIQISEEFKLEIIVGTNVFEFPSKVIAIDGKEIIAEPVRIDNKILNLESSKAVVNLILNRADKSPVVWKRVSVVSIVREKATVYRITAFSDGKEENRRGAFRVNISMAGVAQIGINTAAADVIVKDISDTGYSFITAKDVDPFEGVLVRLAYTDMVEGKSTNLSLIGIVVRKVPYDDNSFLYGCKLNQKYNFLSKYISSKQRDAITKQNEELTIVEGRVVPGFGDLRGRFGEDNTSHRAGSNHDSFDERYRNVDFSGSNNKKKVDYDRYSDLKL